MPVSTTRPTVLLFALLFLATTFQQVAAKFCGCACIGVEFATGEADDCASFCKNTPAARTCKADTIEYYEPRTRLALIISGVAVSAIIVGTIAWCCYRRRRQQKQQQPPVIVYQTAN
ncbi:hypothetical protein BJ741DRAFT_693943 [Chytriomyces cf. hyalinus JEL632]|nr:hypothetical protein BJ741DRAFT_693943 [Chytriomyces cf. hyalinus JEL632]